MNIPLIVIVVVLALFFILHYTSKSKSGGGGVPVVYGSMNCGWTKKLRDTIGPHTFMDCDKEKCPDFVDGYPTTKNPDGSIVVGAK